MEEVVATDVAFFGAYTRMLRKFEYQCQYAILIFLMIIFVDSIFVHYRISGICLPLPGQMAKNHPKVWADIILVV